LAGRRYRFSQYEQKEIFAGGTFQPSNHTIRAGLSYRFGIGTGVSTAQAAD
jgi:opacity protein-like surface antigen